MLLSLVMCLVCVVFFTYYMSLNVLICGPLHLDILRLLEVCWNEFEKWEHAAECKLSVKKWRRIGHTLRKVPTAVEIDQSMFPVASIWSTGHPPHTATELCSSLPPSPRSSSDLQLWPPFELIFSRYYSVVPFVLNLVDSVQEPFGLHWREVSAMYAPTIPIFFVWFLLLLGLGTVLLHRSWLLIVSGHL
jgi:hypothetical protein